MSTICRYTLTILGFVVVAAVAFQRTAYGLDRLPASLERVYDGAFFVDMDHGYVFGHSQQTAVLATEDGGRSWRLVLDFPYGGPNGQLLSVAFATLERFWVLTDKGQLYRTDNGGRTFEVLAPTFVDPRTGRREPLSGRLFFRTNTQGWAADTELVLHTDDGGFTWTPTAIPEALGSALQLWMFNDQEGIATTLEHRGVLRTRNAGREWEAVPRSPNLTAFGCAVTGWCAGLAGTHGPVLVSSDRGYGWIDGNAPVLPGDRDEVYGVQGMSPNQAFAAGSDIGHSYLSDVEPYLEAGKPAPLFAPPQGLLLRWNGRTWTRNTYSDPRSFSGLYFIDADHGWLLAHENAIYKTADGGQTLQFVPDYFRQIAALTPSPTPFVFPTPAPTP